RTAAILDNEFARQKLLHHAVAVHHADAFDRVEGRAAHRAGIHPQGAAHAAGNAFQKLHAGQRMAFGFHSHILQARSRTAAHVVTFHLDPAKARVDEGNYRATKSSVAHEQIRPAAQHEKL